MTPLFKSDYSIGRSILNLDIKEEDKKEKTEFDKICSDSILDLAPKYGIERVFLVEDKMAGFMVAYENFKAKKIDMTFGLRLTICQNMEEKTPESRLTNAKYIIFMDDGEAYKSFIKIYTVAATKGAFGEPRIDFNKLKELWHPNLSLAIPFYDSFLHKNTLTFSTCVPDFTFTDPIFFIEDNNVIFDSLLSRTVKEFTSKNKYELLPAKTIYYAKREDFQAYVTMRCIYGRGKMKESSLNKPNLDFMSSEEFCLESWKEKI